MWEILQTIIKKIAGTTTTIAIFSGTMNTHINNISVASINLRWNLPVLPSFSSAFLSLSVGISFIGSSQHFAQQFICCCNLFNPVTTTKYASYVIARHNEYNSLPTNSKQNPRLLSASLPQNNLSN